MFPQKTAHSGWQLCGAKRCVVRQYVAQSGMLGVRMHHIWKLMAVTTSMAQHCSCETNLFFSPRSQQVSFLVVKVMTLTA